MAYSKRRDISEKVEVPYGMLCTVLGMLMCTGELIERIRKDKLKDGDLSMLDQNNIRCGQIVFKGMMGEFGIDVEDVKFASLIAMQSSLKYMMNKKDERRNDND